MAESQEESNTFSLRTVAANRRHSADGVTGSGSGLAPGRGPVDSDRFHPYRRQFSEGAVAAAGCLQQCSSPYSRLQEVCSPEARLHSDEVPASWEQYNGSIQSSYPELPAVPAEPPCFLSQSYPSYSSSSSLQQVSSRLYPSNDQSSSSKYSLQSLSTPSHQESTTQSLYPKPIYSYSILIFMALKNSKTGSLPVSEIYSFMTEHFPYFKTAPDGWKNSVRHNLSLNKCFEKVENKNGSTSRKGCLWALNPAKVEKMQEELHKWRRKDPITVRRSMARPEELDRLLGERPDKLRSLPSYTNTTLLSRVAPPYSTASSSCTRLRPACQPFRRTQYAHIQPQQPCYLPPAAALPNNSFALYSPCGQQSAAGVPSATANLNSPTAGKMPPLYNATLQAEYSVGPRTMQDLLLEGDASYDVDTLNPSLTDLQLQGNLWEELRDDSLVSESQVTTTTSSTTFVLQDHHIQTSCLQNTPVCQTSAVTAGGRCKAEYEDEDTGGHVEQPGYLNGLHPVVYSGVESLAGYLTSCTTSISLM
ncbi:forkhead box protein N1 [Stegastes partitus]|nr:PREDICTED: forkhead box protein N1 [Stegastes partitus]